MTSHEEIYGQIKEDLSQLSIPYKYRFLSGVLDVIFFDYIHRFYSRIHS